MLRLPAGGVGARSVISLVCAKLTAAGTVSSVYDADGCTEARHICTDVENDCCAHPVFFNESTSCARGHVAVMTGEWCLGQLAKFKCCATAPPACNPAAAGTGTLDTCATATGKQCVDQDRGQSISNYLT